MDHLTSLEKIIKNALDGIISGTMEPTERKTLLNKDQDWKQVVKHIFGKKK